MGLQGRKITWGCGKENNLRSLTQQKCRADELTWLRLCCVGDWGGNCSSREVGCLLIELQEVWHGHVHALSVQPRKGYALIQNWGCIGQVIVPSAHQFFWEGPLLDGQGSKCCANLGNEVICGSDKGNRSLCFRADQGKGLTNLL